MRIVHLISYFDEQTSYEEVITSKLQASLEDNKVFILTSKYSSKDILISRLRPIGKHFLQDNLVIISLRSLIIRNDFIFLIGLFYNLYKIRPNIVHAHGLYQPSNLICYLFSKILNFKLIYDHHDYFFPTHIFYYRGKSIVKNIFRLYYIHILTPLIRKIITNTRKVVAVDPKSYEHLAEWFKIDKNFIFLNELCVDTEKFYYVEENKFNIVTEKTNFVLTGIINRRKLYEEVILPFLDNPSVNLYIIGDGDTDYVNELKHKYMNFENIFFVGNVKNDQLKYYYSFMDYSLFIFNASISILETLACGVLPIYMSDLQFKGALKSGIKIDNISNYNAHLLGRQLKIERSKRASLIHFIKCEFSYKKYIAILNKIYES
jgi:hypothetical protein